MIIQYLNSMKKEKKKKICNGITLFFFYSLFLQILMASGATYEPPNTAGGQTYDVLVETFVKFKRSLSSQQIALENVRI